MNKYVEKVDTVKNFKQDADSIQNKSELYMEQDDIQHHLNFWMGGSSALLHSLGGDFAQTKCFYNGILQYVWKNLNCKLGEISYAKCVPNSSIIFGEQMTLIILNMSADGSKFKIARKYEIRKRIFKSCSLSYCNEFLPATRKT